MDFVYGQSIQELGYSHLVCDIFSEWEDVKDEILIPERKSGSGNGTIHIFLGAADTALRKEFPGYYDDVEKGVDPAFGAIHVTHYFLSSNVISMLGYVCKYYCTKSISLDENITPIISQLSDKNKELLSTTSLLKLSIGSGRLRPYFKQFESNGVFTQLIRKILLPNSSYKISLYKNDKNEYAAFWLIGFDWLTDFEANAQKRLLGNEKIVKEGLPLQQIFYGAPGTGKSHYINDVTKTEEVVRTTFHPDSDYSTFVGAYKPTSIDVPMRDVTGKIIEEGGVKVTEKRIVYNFVPQAFLQAYVRAWKSFAASTEGQAAKKQFLVIEEINRGNCAQIFGDLFQLLDRGDNGFSEYPINADTDLKKYLQQEFAGISISNVPAIGNMSAVEVGDKVKSGEILLLPNNLYIWATMNTSDQSLFPIDSAFKRRWDWVYIKIKDHRDKNYQIQLGANQQDWWSFVEKINVIIASMTSSADKQLGYFFCKADSAGIISAETFVSKVIFYLWNDVFKDSGFEDASLFQYEDKDATGNKIVKDLTFPDFYDESGQAVNIERVADFVNKVLNWKKSKDDNS